MHIQFHSTADVEATIVTAVEFVNFKQFEFLRLPEPKIVVCCLSFDVIVEDFRNIDNWGVLAFQQQLWFLHCGINITSEEQVKPINCCQRVLATNDNLFFTPTTHCLHGRHWVLMKYRGFHLPRGFVLGRGRCGLNLKHGSYRKILDIW